MVTKSLATCRVKGINFNNLNREEFEVPFLLIDYPNMEIIVVDNSPNQDFERDYKVDRELTVGVVSALRKKVDFALGNVLGSNIYNILGILGVSSFFGTFYIPTMVANFDLYVMISVTVVITLFMLLYKKLSRSYGIFSLIIYFSYIFYLYI